MNHIESIAGKQSVVAPPNQKLNCELRQAIKVINAEYQQIDWEDQAFLNRILANVLQSLEVKEGNVNYGAD